MSPETLSSPATTETTIDTNELLERLRVLDAQRGVIMQEESRIRLQLAGVLQQRQEVAAARITILSPETFEELRDDISHTVDGDFVPSERDNARHAAFLQRQGMLIAAEENVRQIQRGLSLSTHEWRIDSLERDLRYYDGGLLWKAAHYFSDEPERIRKSIAKARGEKAKAEQKVPYYQAQLPAAREALAAEEAKENVPYDPALHNEYAKSVTLLHRSEQSVLLSLSGNSRQATLILPASPDADDLTVSVTIDLHDDDNEDFASLIGDDLYVNGRYSSSVKECVEYGEELEPTLVPLALESVTMPDGQERIRLPRAVWERFKDRIS